MGSVNMNIENNPDWRLIRADPAKCVVVEREIRGVTPSYRVFGKTRCDNCKNWCWLGREPFKFVMNGNGIPLCVDCAKDILHPDGLIDVLPD